MTATFYDDAELAAVTAIRFACAENHDVGMAEPLHALLLEVQERCGEAGLLGLVAALARHASAHVDLAAERLGTTSDAWLDNWALHKMAQHQFEDDEWL